MGGSAIPREIPHSPQGEGSFHLLSAVVEISLFFYANKDMSEDKMAKGIK